MFLFYLFIVYVIYFKIKHTKIVILRILSRNIKLLAILFSETIKYYSFLQNFLKTIKFRKISLY